MNAKKKTKPANSGNKSAPANAEPLIENIADQAVDAVLDQQLRDLLCACYLKPVDVVFRDRRFFREPPDHHWLVRDAAARPIAQVSVHERALIQDWRRIPMGGIAEVCVHPDYRGRGLVRQMVCQLGAQPWPVDPVLLPGLTF